MNYIKNLVNYTRTFLIFTIATAMLLAPVTSSALSDDETELLKAAFSGKSETIKQLLDKELNPDLQNEMGFSALIIASQYGHADIVNLLLEKNANVDLQNTGGATALIVAAKNGHDDVVNALLAKNAKVDLQTSDDITALMLAVSNLFMTFAWY
ncbi:MAG: ankyrin repeat domain-containing protein, partial [Pseudomonadota bacterium]